MATPSISRPQVLTTQPQVRPSRRMTRDAPLGYALVAPAVVLILLLVGYPFARALWLSFHKKLLGKVDAPWIGLGNYNALLQDHRFWQASKNVLVFTGGSVAIKLVLGLTIALILNEALPLRNLWRSIVLLPYAMPTLVSVLIWKWMYNDTAGILNYLLKETGIRQNGILWLSDPGTSMRAVAPSVLFSRRITGRAGSSPNWSAVPR